MIEQNGTYYLYVTFVKPDEKMGTYVMIADRPDGPFRFAEGNGLFAPGVEGVDSPFIVNDKFFNPLSSDAENIIFDLSAESIAAPTVGFVDSSTPSTSCVLVVVLLFVLTAITVNVCLPVIASISVSNWASEPSCGYIV